MRHADFDLLELAEHMQKCFGESSGFSTGRTTRKRDAERLVAMGWLRRDSLVMVDGDGYTIEPERYRPGYVLIQAGADALKLAREHLGQDGYPMKGNALDVHTPGCSGCGRARDLARAARKRQRSKRG